MLRWERSRGVYFSPDEAITAEAIDAAWDRIRNFEDATHPNTISDTFTPVFGNFGIQM
jgi:hypothetical protein